MLDRVLLIRFGMKQRIATVKATGDRYIVQRLSIGATDAQTRVYVWGEVLSFKTGRGHTRVEQLATSASTKHGPSKAFTRDAVDIAEVDVTGNVAEELLKQATRNVSNVRGIQSRQVRK